MNTPSFHLVRNLGELEALSPNALGELKILADMASSKPVRPGTEETLTNFFVLGGAMPIACDGTKVIGAVQLAYKPRWNGPPAAFLNCLAVLPEYRRNGIAGKLHSMLQAEAQAKGAMSIDLSSNEDNKAANALYRKLGYRLRKGNFWRLG